MSGTFFVRTASPTSTISPPELRRSSSLSSDAMNLRISASTCAGGEVERACAWTYSPTIEDSRAETIRSCLGVISAFATNLASALNRQNSGFRYAPDDTGVYTDTNEYAGIVPECTNLSVGYQRQHGPRETLDVVHCEQLLEA